MNPFYGGGGGDVGGATSESVAKPMDLSYLTEAERTRILEVLKRDERLAKKQNEKYL